MREIRNVRGVENEPVKKGELKQPEEKLIKLDKALSKIEEKTDKLIEKSKKLANKSATNQQQVDNQSNTNRIQTNSTATRKREPSIIEFYCLKSLSKIIMSEIKDKTVFDEYLQNWIAVIDTEEIKNKSKKSAKHISVQMLRLENEGWFKIIKSSTAGMRVLAVNTKAIPINQ